MATAVSEWMTQDQLGLFYKNRWVKTSRIALTFDRLEEQLSRTPKSEKGVVFLLLSDKDLTNVKVNEVDIKLKGFAARKKNGAWKFSEESEDIDFVLAEISGLSVDEYRKVRDDKAFQERQRLLGAVLNI